MLLTEFFWDIGYYSSFCDQTADKKLKLGRVYFDLEVRVIVHHGEEGRAAWDEVGGHTAHSQEAKVEPTMESSCEISLPNPVTYFPQYGTTS